MKVFRSDGADRLESLIEEKTDELDLEIIERAIQPDHIPEFITRHPKLASNTIIQQLKG